MKLCLVASHGGHMTELLALQDAFREHEVFYCSYVSPVDRGLQPLYTFPNLTERPWHLVPVLVRVFRLLRTERPDVIVSTGAEIAIPFCLLGRLLGVRVVFIESVCRVRTPSVTGRLLYYLSDAFFVQWPSLLRRYGPKARFVGGLL